MIGLLRIKVRRGIDLVARDNSTSDPYVVVSVPPQRVKTKAVGNSCNPEWNDELSIGIYSLDIPITLSVYDKDKFSKDDKMGDAKVDIGPINECRKRQHGEVPSGSVLSKVEPNRGNCLAEESEVVWKDGKLVQEMILKLNNTERGKVVIQLEWIDVPKRG